MLDQYIEELAKSAKVQHKLDAHLEGLAKQAAAEVETQTFLEKATVAELAKLAGITLPENVCGGCGGEMQKLGSIFQCGCGLMKKAKAKKAGLVDMGAARALQAGTNAAAGRLTGRMAAGRAARAAANPQTAAQAAAPLMTGAGGGQLTARELAAGQNLGTRVSGALQRAGGALKKVLPGGGAAGATAPATLVPKYASIKKEALLNLGTISGAVEGGEGHRLGGAAAGTLGGIVGGGVGGLAGLGGGALLGAGLGALTRNPSAGARIGAGLGALGGGTVGQWKGGRLAAKELLNSSAQKTASEKCSECGGALEKDGEMSKCSGCGCMSKAASFAKFAQVMRATGGDVDRTLAHLENQGYTKLGFSMGAVKALGTKALGAATRTGQSVRNAYTMGSQGITRQGGKLVGGGQEGVMGGLKAVASRHPGVAATAAAVPVAGAGYMMGKTSAAHLLEVGDAAGRILAKVANFDPSEIEESIEEAREREDVPGRAHRWALGGGALGALGGGALGGGAAHFLGANPWVRAGAAGLGAIAGGLGGAHMGSEHGAEEAEADRIVSMLRGRKAYGAGMQQGYMAGMGMGGDEGNPQ